MTHARAKPGRSGSVLLRPVALLAALNLTTVLVAPAWAYDPGKISPGTFLGNPGAAKATPVPVPNTPVLHESQGGDATLLSNFTLKGDFFKVLSADISLSTKATVTTSGATAGEAPGLRFTLNSTNYDFRYTVLAPGGTPDSTSTIAMGICSAIEAAYAANTSGFKTALNNTLDLQNQGMGNPFQTGCAQVSANALTFDQPYVGGTTVSALNTTHYTITIVGGVTGTGAPKADGNPVLAATRRYPVGYTLGANDLGSYLYFEYQIGNGAYLPAGFIKTIYGSSSHWNLAMGAVGGAGLTFGNGLSLDGCLGDKGVGTFSACSTYSTQHFVGAGTTPALSNDGSGNLQVLGQANKGVIIGGNGAPSSIQVNANDSARIETGYPMLFAAPGALTTGPSIGAAANVMTITGGTSGVQFNANNNGAATFSIDNSANAIFRNTVQFGTSSGPPPHLTTAQTTAPALTSCGTSPTISGTDTAGTVTMGTGTPTGCVITFNAAYAAAPHCVVTWRATPLTSQSYAVSTTAITLTQTATSSNIVDYLCMGNG